MEEIIAEILRRMLEAHKLMRHDYMNHLQVISGYLQLGQPEKAKKNINQVSGWLERFKDLGRIDAPVLQALLLYYCATAGDEDCFNVEVTGKIKLEEKEDQSLAMLVRELIDPLVERVVTKRWKCRIDLKGSGLINVVLTNLDPPSGECIDAKHLAGLEQRHPRFSLALMEKPGQQEHEITITTNEAQVKVFDRVCSMEQVNDRYGG